MPTRPFSEEFFEGYCLSRDVPCQPIPPGPEPTPDFLLRFGSVDVVCEVKQIDPNKDDLEVADAVSSGEAAGRFVPNRLRDKLKQSSKQLQAASKKGDTTLLVVYDNTPFKMYTMHDDVAQAMIGVSRVKVTWTSETGAAPLVFEPVLRKNKGFTPDQNTSVSALAILDGGPVSEGRMRVYHNPYARVALRPGLLDALCPPNMQF